ncbi:hypothetical protein EYC80_008871 [Monilinia laxa]|uniref:Uncharacterized protein n=1 Tax=Monilinia laxa TaxID=61186 RepID=A0A5N6K214_MONLA|nr:hypothetical protein EYC80_008871 [Monilinia laxa]
MWRLPRTQSSAPQHPAISKLHPRPMTHRYGLWLNCTLKVAGTCLDPVCTPGKKILQNLGLSLDARLNQLYFFSFHLALKFLCLVFVEMRPLVPWVAGCLLECCMEMMLL